MPTLPSIINTLLYALDSLEVAVLSESYRSMCSAFIFAYTSTPETTRWLMPHSCKELGPLAHWLATDVLTIVPIITQAITIASDALVLFFTLTATLSTYRDSKEAQVKTKLTTALIRNGQYLMIDEVRSLWPRINRICTVFVSNQVLDFPLHRLKCR